MSVPEETLLDHIAEDKFRKSFEKESRILWSRATERVQFFSTNRAEMRRLLSHPHFQLKWCEVTFEGEPRKTRRVTIDGISELDFEDRRVVALEGYLPLGCVSVKRDPRTAGSHADVVTKGVLSND